MRCTSLLIGLPHGHNILKNSTWAFLSWKFFSLPKFFDRRPSSILLRLSLILCVLRSIKCFPSRFRERLALLNLYASPSNHLCFLITDEDEIEELSCLENPCRYGGTCVVTSCGSYECKCRPGFSGKHCDCGKLHYYFVMWSVLQIYGWNERGLSMIKK